MLNGLIIGGGISGLSAAHWLGLHDHPDGWEIWEASDHVGGTMGTDTIDGYCLDWGPNGFLDREPLTLQLVAEIGLSGQLEYASENARNRFLLKEGRLYPVPMSAGAVLTTGLLSIGERLRLFAEPFIPARKDDADESIHDFATRRIGRGAAQTFVDPMVSGIFGGDSKTLSLPACFPIMRELEAKHGGLVRGMIARQLHKVRGGKKRGGPSGPGGRLAAFHGGIGQLPARLAERFESIIRLSRAADRIERNPESWLVTDVDGQSVSSRRIVITTPAYVCAQMFRDSDPELSSAFAEIPYAPMVVVATGHRREDIAHPLDGFGFLVPRDQGLRILGSIWTSSIFSGRAPVGQVQMRTMLGGAGDPTAAQLSDDDLWRSVRREIGSTIGLRADPVFIRVNRWGRAIPQYTLGHRERRAAIEHLASRYPGLHVIGNAYYGVGINDCVKMAKAAADRILAS